MLLVPLKGYLAAFSLLQVRVVGAGHYANYFSEISSVDREQTQVSPSEQCINSAVYMYANDIGQSCKWIRRDESCRQNLCIHAEVVLNCPVSCGYCCKDDPDYRFKVNLVGVRKCKWLKTNKEKNKVRNKY